MHTTTPAPGRLRTRRLAATVAGALAASGVALVGAPAAQAAVVPSTALTWGISTQFVDHLSTRTLSGGVTFDETGKTFSFPGVKTTKAANGDLTRQYAGTVKGAFVNAGTEYYQVTLANPTVTVEADGDGRIQATVSASNAAAGPSSPAAATDPKLVTVAEFTGATSTLAGTTVTPNWTGVLPADSAEAVALGIGAGKPVDGASFHPAFLGNLTAGVRAHFYASGAGSDVKKPPAALIASSVPTVTATVTGSSAAAGVTVKVDGVGFNPSTLAGDAGVYVGLAPAATVINYGSQSATSSFAAVDWVTPARFTSDSFTTVLTAPSAKLVPGTEYAVFTWQAHTHSNTTQDTKTAVAIDWSTLAVEKTPPTVKTKPTAKTKLDQKATLKKAGKAVISVKGTAAVATGEVKVTIKRPGVKAKKVTTVGLDAQGAVEVKLPKAKKSGTYKVVASYLGDEANSPVKVVKKFKVKR